MEYRLMSISMKGIFNILEKLNMCFPNGKGGLDDKVQFSEKISYKLTSKNKTIKGS